MKNKIIFGFHAVTSRLRHEASSVEEIYVDSERTDRRMQDLLKVAKAAGVRIIVAESLRLDKMAGMLAGKLGGSGGGQPIVVQCVLDGRVIASSTVDYINRRARATGIHPLGSYI